MIRKRNVDDRFVAAHNDETSRILKENVVEETRGLLVRRKVVRDDNEIRAKLFGIPHPHPILDAPFARLVVGRRDVCRSSLARRVRDRHRLVPPLGVVPHRDRGKETVLSFVCLSGSTFSVSTPFAPGGRARERRETDHVDVKDEGARGGARDRPWDGGRRGRGRGLEVGKDLLLEADLPVGEVMETRLFKVALDKVVVGRRHDRWWLHPFCLSGSRSRC